MTDPRLTDARLTDARLTDVRSADARPPDARPDGVAAAERAVAALRCPVCGAPCAAIGSGLRCAAGHSFDRARQGYFSLLSGAAIKHRSDTAAMVAARRRILDDGVFAAVTGAVAAAVPTGARLIVDAGAGTGHYLAAALDAAHRACGVGLDLSKFCGRSLARSHPRALAVVCDVWSGLPIASSSTDVVLTVFAPRNVAETARILAPGGQWLLVTPNPRHLEQVRAAMGMLDIAPGKLDRLHADLADGGFAVQRSTPIVADLDLTAGQTADLAGMGPAGFHRSEAELAAAAGALAGASGGIRVTLDVTLTVATRH